MRPSENEPSEKNAREDTDQSLRGEREKTDDEVSRRRQSVEEDSDAVVKEARTTADEVLTKERDLADRAMQDKDTPARTIGNVSADRIKEDEVLQQERDLVDQRLELERRERTLALAELFRLERETTDSHLAIERERSDDALFSRDDFMGMVSHDLRDMLGGIALNIALVVKDAKNEDSAQALQSILRRAEVVQRFTARMNGLIGDLVDVESIEAGKFKITPTPGEMTKVVNESVEIFQPSATAKDIALSLEIAKGPFITNFDRERILQVLANLLGNAIKVAPKRGHVTVRLERIDGDVRFAISDSGPGIDAANHHVVFSRSWQAATGDRRGVGLGLYISKRIVESHRGRIWVESQPGQGSTFYFTIPAT